MSFDDSECDVSVTERRRSVFHVKNVNFNEDNADFTKTTAERTLIAKALQSNEFLKNILNETTKSLVIDMMTPITVKKDQIIIHQDEIGEFLYVSQTGSYQVLKNSVEVHKFDGSTVFGEVAIIYNHKRHATVKAVTDGRLWVIHKDNYSQIMINNVREQDADVLEFLEKVPVLCKAPVEKRQQAAGLFTTCTFKCGTNIVKEGDEGKDFYIIKAGTVKVFKSAHEGCLATLSRGQYFGQHALLNQNGVRQATVTVETPVVECLVLHCSYFINLFGGIQDFLKQPDEVDSISPIVINKEFKSIELHDLRLRGTIGEGGIGRIELCHRTGNDKQLFALKYMHRTRVVQQDLIKYVQREKDIQLRCQNAFIVQLYKTYNDHRYIYLLQEYCPGGDLLNRLQRSRAHYCKENDAKFVTACVFEAIGYLHEKHFIFRDIKPENLLLDSKGYVKLTDFGCARRLDPGYRTFSMHGAPEYMTPECIYQRGSDRAVDYWACGILMFELLVGKTPFKHKDASHMQTYNAIVRGIGSIKFPSRVSKVATDLITSLCNSTPHERIGYCSGIQAVRHHKWYQTFDWVKLRNCQMTSPFVFKLSNAMDTRYFDKFQPDKYLPKMDDTFDLNNF